MTYTMYTIETNPYEVKFYNHDNSWNVDIFAKTICHVYLYKPINYKRTTLTHRSYIIMTKIVNKLANYKELEDLNE